MSKLSKAFGAKIKEKRDLLGLKQSQLGEIIGVEPGTVSRWENGEFVPSESTLKIIEEKLGFEDYQFVPIKGPSIDELAHLIAKETLKSLQPKNKPSIEELIAIVGALDDKDIRTLLLLAKSMLEVAGDNPESGSSSAV